MNAIPMQAVAAMGRNGDTQLAHINAKEALLLKLFGGSGTINPKTGLLEFYDDSSEGADNEGGGDTGSPSGSGAGEEAAGNAAEAASQEAAANRDADAANSIGGSFGFYEGLQPPDPNEGRDSFNDIAELAHPKNTYFENIKDEITTTISGLIRGFTGFAAKTAGRTTAKTAAALGFGVNPVSALGVGIGLAGGWLGGYIAENASPPSESTVAEYMGGGTGPGAETEASGMETASAEASPASTTTRSGIPMARRPQIGLTRQYSALTGMPAQYNIPK
jgi:hypothetical protein